MMISRKYILPKAILIICLSYAVAGKAQLVIPIEIPDTSLVVHHTHESLSFQHYKKLPKGFEEQALKALAQFPELKNVPIRFRIKKSFATLKTRPDFPSMFMPRGYRRYIIIISNRTAVTLAPILLAHLPYEAQIGIIGHELSHVSDFSNRTSWQCFKIAINHFASRYMDNLEFNTDLICIQHGLGKQLETWSSYIRNTMHTNYWRGADYVYKGDGKYERYMNPATIEKYMESNNTSTTKSSHSTIENAR